MSRISVAELKTMQKTGEARLVGQSKKPRRGRPEEELQRTIILWADAKPYRYPALKWLFHPANGGGRSKAEAGALKACGVRKGVPDLIIPMRFSTTAGLAVELKTPTNSLSEDQREWLVDFHSNGYVVGVARSLEEFEILVQAYYGMRPNDDSLPGNHEIFNYKRKAI